MTFLPVSRHATFHPIAGRRPNVISRAEDRYIARYFELFSVGLARRYCPDVAMDDSLYAWFGLCRFSIGQFYPRLIGHRTVYNHAVIAIWNQLKATKSARPTHPSEYRPRLTLAMQAGNKHDQGCQYPTTKPSQRSCCFYSSLRLDLLGRPAELCSVDPHAMQDHSHLPGNGDLGLIVLPFSVVGRSHLKNLG